MHEQVKPKMLYYLNEKGNPTPQAFHGLEFHLECTTKQNYLKQFSFSL